MCHCVMFKVRGAQRGGRNRGRISIRHSRAGGSPVFCAWIPGRGLRPPYQVRGRLARNDGLVVFVIPAKAGIQGVWYGFGILFLSRSRATKPSRMRQGAKTKLASLRCAETKLFPTLTVHFLIPLTFSEVLSVLCSEQLALTLLPQV